MKKQVRLFFESIRFAFQALKTNRMRTYLTLATIAIGIFAMILPLAFISSMEANIRSGMSVLGNDMIYIMRIPWVPDDDGVYRIWDYIRRPAIDFKDFELLKNTEGIPANVALSASSSGTLEHYDGVNTMSVENVQLSLVTYDYYLVQSVVVEEGRYFSRLEAQSGANVVLLGADLATNLFGSADPVGKAIKLRGRKVSVIGVLKREGSSMFGGSKDNLAIVPLNYARTFISLDRIENIIQITPKPDVDMQWLTDRVTGRMRAIRRIKPGEDPNFALNESSMISQGFDNFFGSLNAIGFGVGGFVMLVGGFSIANIMLVSVQERTPLIGIQKSLGARNAFILTQFLSEAVMLCLIGGGLGLLLVWLAAMGISSEDFPMTLSYANIVIGLLISTGTGLAFGILPAIRASKLNPVDAIRS